MEDISQKESSNFCSSSLISEESRLRGQLSSRVHTTADKTSRYCRKSVPTTGELSTLFHLYNGPKTQTRYLSIPVMKTWLHLGWLHYEKKILMLCASGSDSAHIFIFMSHQLLFPAFEQQLWQLTILELPSLRCVSSSNIQRRTVIEQTCLCKSWRISFEKIHEYRHCSCVFLEIWTFVFGTLIWESTACQELSDVWNSKKKQPRIRLLFGTCGMTAIKD